MQLSAVFYIPFREDRYVMITSQLWTTYGASDIMLIGIGNNSVFQPLNSDQSALVLVAT